MEVEDTASALGGAGPAPPLERSNSRTSNATTVSKASGIFTDVDMDKEPEHLGQGLSQGASKFHTFMTAGSEKFMRKPREAVQKHGPLGIVKGAVEGQAFFWSDVTRGSAALINQTLEGCRNTPDLLAKRNGAVGEPPLLQTYRAEGDEPVHVFDGVAKSSFYLGVATADGLKDLVNKPVKGAQEEGVPGFLYGLSEGTSGCTRKIAAGGFDFAQTFVAGIGNTPKALDNVLKGYPMRSQATASTAVQLPVLADSAAAVSASAGSASAASSSAASAPAAAPSGGYPAAATTAPAWSSACGMAPERMRASGSVPVPGAVPGQDAGMAPVVVNTWAALVESSKPKPTALGQPSAP